MKFYAYDPSTGRKVWAEDEAGPAAAAAQAAADQAQAAADQAQAAADQAQADVDALTVESLQWLGVPVGQYITPLTPPPKDDPRFRYVLCTAGETGSGKYNEGILTGETVTGTAPLLNATATVSLAGSPFNGLSIHLINTEGRFVGAGTAEAFEDDSIQNITGTTGRYWGVDSVPSDTGVFGYVDKSSSTLASASGGPAYPSRSQFDASRVARTSDHTQPRAHRLPHYRRIK